MRLSVVAVSLILFFSQSTLAQHSSGGGGSSGGGTSSGGSSSGSSGGGSHGGGGSSGGSSGGHVSGGGSGSHGSGSSGHAPGKIDTLHATANGPASEPAFYSSVHGESSEVHNQLLDQALAKLQYALPVNFKNGQPFSAESLKRVEPTSERKEETKLQVKKAEPDRKPCHGHHCHATEYRTPGTNWRMSQDLYTTLQGDCGHLAAKLQQEENKASALKASQDSVCATNPVGSACASATEGLNKLNAKIVQLHDRYDQCVLHDLRHKAAVSVSRK
jgi:hypothetical protein